MISKIEEGSCETLSNNGRKSSSPLKDSRCLFGNENVGCMERARRAIERPRAARMPIPFEVRAAEWERLLSFG